MAELLVVDDELPVRLALRSLGDWQSCGINVVHEAGNGKEALRLLENNPDIAVLITDIKMPVMDGIELISLAHQFYPNLSIFVLSSFNDYDLIREAFKRGACDYILKHRMEPEAVVAQVRDCLYGRGPLEVKPLLLDTPEVRTREWLLMLAMQKESDDTVLPVAPLDLAVTVERLSVLHLWIDDYYRVQARYLDYTLPQFIGAMTDVMGRFLAAYPGSLQLSLSPQEFLLFIPWRFSTWNIEARQGMQELCHALLHYLDITVSIGISTPVDDAGQVGTACREARSLVQLRHLLGRNRIIFPQDAKPSIISDQGLPSIDTALLVDQMTTHDFDQALESWKVIITSLSSYRLPSMVPYRQIALRLVFLLFDQLTKAGIDVVDSIGARHDPFAELPQIESLPDLGSWLTEIGVLCFGSLREEHHMATSHYILRARRYLDKNYQNPELSLVEVASQVGLSRTYLSSLFEKEIGMCYSEYLNMLRIKEARRLLKTTGLKLYEISERCGFNSVEYFSRIFRKLCNTTPAQYR